jgi:cell division protein FtsB
VRAAALIWSPMAFDQAKARRILIYALLAILLLLQYPLWFGSGSVRSIWQLRREIAAQKTENARLKERNEALEAEVSDLKQGLAAIEDRARNELGMVKKGETFYQIIEPASPKRADPPARADTTVTPTKH